MKIVAIAGVLGCSLGCTSAPSPAMSGPHEDAAPRRRDAGPAPTGDETSPGADAGRPPPPIACPPAPQRFKPPPFVPSSAHQGRCTTAEIADFVSECVSPGTTCLSWSIANAPGFVDGGRGTECGACLFAPRNNGGCWRDPIGPFTTNFGGCIQILDPVHGPACAEDINDFNGCEAYACDYCPDFSPKDHAACLSATLDGGVCSSYLKAGDVTCQAASDAYFTCTANPNTPASYTFITNLICGPGPSDAGPDSASD